MVTVRLLAAIAASCALLALAPAAAADEGFLGIVLKQARPGVVEIEGTASGASAQKAGVKPGDLLVSFNGTKIATPDELIKIVKATTPGAKGTLVVKRGRARKSFEILIVSRSEFLGAGIEALKGKPLPELSGQLVLEGRKFDFSTLKGKPTVLELWATWCPACQANIPHLDEFAKHNKGKVNVVALSFESPKTVKHFFSRSRVSYDVVATEPGEVNAAYMSNSTIPKFIIVDSKGVVNMIAQSGADLDTIDFSKL